MYTYNYSQDDYGNGIGFGALSTSTGNASDVNQGTGPVPLISLSSSSATAATQLNYVVGSPNAINERVARIQRLTKKPVAEITGSSFLSRFSIDLLVILPIVLLVATAFFSLIERPCMDPAWVAKLAGRFRQPKLSTRDAVV